MYPGTRPTPKTSSSDTRFIYGKQQDSDTWTPPISLPQKVVEQNRIKAEWTPHDWIKEWSQALEKSAYPQWESWFQKRDWNCDGHLSVKHPAFFSESVQIGDINLQHKLHVKGDSYLCGNLYIEGRVIHSKGTKQKGTDWDLENEPDVQSWEETFETYHQSLTAFPNENWGGWSIHHKINNESGGLFVEFNENGVNAFFHAWSGDSGFSKDDSIPIQVHIENLHLKKNLYATNEVTIFGEWNWGTSTVNLQQTNLQLPAKIEWNEPEIILRNTNKLQLHSQNTMLIGDVTVHYSDFTIAPWFSITKSGVGTYQGENFTFQHNLQANHAEFYEGLTTPRAVFDDVVHARRIITQETAWIGGTLQVAPGFSIHTDQIVIESPLEWLQLPEEASKHMIPHLSVEYWGVYPAPSSRPLTEEEPGVLSNKHLGTNLHAGGYQLKNLGEPESNRDAATKEYVDRVRLPWSYLPAVSIWFSRSEVMKLASYIKQSGDWSGKITGTSNHNFLQLHVGDRIGIYPDILSDWYTIDDGCGIFDVTETFDGKQIETWRQHDFHLTLSTDYVNFCKNQENQSKIVWLGGPKSKRGGGYLWIIENKKNAQLWNIIMEWEEVSNEMSKELELLHKRIAVLESEFKSSRISNN